MQSFQYYIFEIMATSPKDMWLIRPFCVVCRASSWTQEEDERVEMAEDEPVMEKLVQDEPLGCLVTESAIRITAQLGHLHMTEAGALPHLKNAGGLAVMLLHQRILVVDNGRIESVHDKNWSRLG